MSMAIVMEVVTAIPTVEPIKLRQQRKATVPVLAENLTRR